MGYLRDLSSRLPYCKYSCYGEQMVAVLPLIGAMMVLQWASDFQGAFLRSWDK
jgi:hypothetical protein